MTRLAIIVPLCVVTGAVWLFQTPSAAGYELSRGDDRKPSLIDPSITKDPLEVLVWFRENVTAQDADRVLADIRAGLDLWERIPTCHLRFITTSIRSATRPQLRPSQLLVVAAYKRDLPRGSGGAPLPSGGRPGSWEGAVVDPFPEPGAFSRVASHEIGHALGFLHTSISDTHFIGTPVPIMHWAHGRMLSPDDIAAASVAYPDPANPLWAVTGTLRGRCVDARTGFPINGVNIVAVQEGTSRPVIARLTGTEHTPGGFELAGLPQGRYTLHALNGRSFRGQFIGMAQQYVQADNFDPMVSGPYTIKAQDVLEIEALRLPIEPVTVEAAAHSRTALIYATRLTPQPPPAAAGETYQAWLRLRGGIRPLQLVDQAGLPPGLEAGLFSMIQSTGSDPNGEHFVVLGGLPQQAGRFALSFIIEDLHHHRETLEVTLVVEPAPH